MIIDIATHVYPKQVFDRVKRIAPGFGSMGTRIDNTRQLYDFDDRFRLIECWSWGRRARQHGQINGARTPSCHAM